ncbi:MAG: cation-translocating P-type ATPase [Candidatus Caccovivens sp.]
MSKDFRNLGLSSDEAKRIQQECGKNLLVPKKKDNFFKKILLTLAEPMFLLLIIASIIYFILGEARDGAIMLVFVVAVISIDIIQEWKTDKTLNTLKQMSEPHIKVIRDGEEQEIASEDLVPGDIMLIHEGIKIPADGVILSLADLCIDESSLTGESVGVWKCEKGKAEADDYWRRDYCYAGTLVTQGSAVVQVEKIGTETEYGKIGLGVAQSKPEKTPLQKQTDKLVKTCAIIAGILFVLVAVITWFNSSNLELGDRIITSILAGITLAMAMIPEEFPVILTVFLSMGAWRLAKKKSLVRKLPSVETLGAISVLCVDKTGTITENRMSVQSTWLYKVQEDEFLRIMGLACEVDAYDPMEKAMLEFCKNKGIKQKELFSNKFVSEYAFTNELKMMGHIWEIENGNMLCSKGSPEKILSICNLTNEEKKEIELKIDEFARQGQRVIAVARHIFEVDEEIAENLTDYKLEFLGIVGLADPAREGIKKDIETCTKAGIRVVMITGDNGITASAIAKQVGIPNSENVITGEMLDNMSDEELREKVKSVSIFSRVVPEHKKRIVKAFKDNGEIVAMTGDGVNDAPALKIADIGIAMGKRGSEVSREAADLILLDDNFSTIVETIKDGRRIYDNIKKAVGYVFAIHIPIALASLLAPLLGIASSALLLLPLHIMLLELLIDPTCSIVLERQPCENNVMDRAPRSKDDKLLTLRLLGKSVLQGLILFAVSFGTYYYVLTQTNLGTETARSMGLVIIMFANMFLVQVISSKEDYAITSVKKLAKDKVMWIINILSLFMIAVILYTPLSSFLKLAPLSFVNFVISLALGFASVMWFEFVKLFKKIKRYTSIKEINNEVERGK